MQNSGGGCSPPGDRQKKKLAKYSMTHQKISLGYPRATFSWYLVPTRDINYVDYVVCQFSAKVSSQVICMRNAQTAPFNAWLWSCVKRWILPRTKDTRYHSEAEGCLKHDAPNIYSRIGMQKFLFCKDLKGAFSVFTLKHDAKFTW